MHFQFPSQRKLGVRRGTKAASNTKPGSRLFSLGTHAYVEDATRETSFGLCITKKRPPTNWIHDGLGRLEFNFGLTSSIWSYLIFRLFLSLALLFDLESIDLASMGLVVRGPTWETLSRRFSHAVSLREISVPRVSNPLKQKYCRIENE